MSYDVYLCDPVSREVLHAESPHLIYGGTYVMGGTTKPWLNITYNYAKPYDAHHFSIRDLDGKNALDMLPEVERVISELGDDVDADYWNPTEGNAKRALVQLRTLMKMRPDAVIEVH